MIRRLSAVLLAASLAAGLGAFAGQANAGAATNLVTAAKSAVVPTTSPLVQEAQWSESGRSYRRHHYRDWDRWDRRDRWDRDDRYWRKKWRRHHYRHHRPQAGIYFEFRSAPRYYRAPAPVYRLSSAHYRWCNYRYRSYRSYDNSWQPYHGPRRQCISPYS